jgi:hypothetical protein
MRHALFPALSSGSGAEVRLWSGVACGIRRRRGIAVSTLCFREMLISVAGKRSWEQYYGFYKATCRMA